MRIPTIPTKNTREKESYYLYSLLISLIFCVFPTKAFAAVCPACIFAVAAVIKGETSPDISYNIWNIAMPIFTLISILIISAAEYMKKKKIEISHIDMSFFSLLFSFVGVIIMVVFFPKVFPSVQNAKFVIEYLSALFFGSYVCHIVYIFHCTLKAKNLTFMFSRVIFLFVVLIGAQYITNFAAHAVLAGTSVVIMSIIYFLKYSKENA